MTAAVSTRGLRLQRGDGATTEVFTTIGEVTDFTGPSETTEQLDATSFDSTAQEFIAGLPDNGEVSFDMNFVGSNAQQQGLRADLRAGTVRNFRLILNDHATTDTQFAFAAIVTNLSIQGASNAIIKASCTLKLTGAATVTYAPA